MNNYLVLLSSLQYLGHTYKEKINAYLQFKFKWTCRGFFRQPYLPLLHCVHSALLQEPHGMLIQFQVWKTLCARGFLVKAQAESFL